VKKTSLFFVVVLCAIICFSQSSPAQNIGTLSTGVNIGASLYTSGTSTGGTSSAFHIGVESAYRLNFNTALVANVGYTGDVATTIWEVSGNGRYFFTPEQEYKFFGEAGLGVYTVQVEFLGLVLESKKYLGLNLGGGVSKNVGRGIDLNLKMKYHNPFVSGGSLNYINITVGCIVQI